MKRTESGSASTVVGVVLALVILGALVVLSPEQDETTFADDSRAQQVQSSDRPSPQDSDSDRPLGSPASVSNPSGSYKFMFTRTGTEDPVTYDPCRKIRVVVNPRTQPVGGDSMLREAFEEISRTTGLQFEMLGRTDESISKDRADFQTERYGDRWAPVLVGWSDPSEYKGLKGDTAGEAGSSWFGNEDDPSSQAYVSGTVALDGPQIEDIMQEPNGYRTARSIVMHELAHLVGLDHVDDETQLMYGESTDVAAFQDGDLTGLAQLGKGSCIKGL